MPSSKFRDRSPLVQQIIDRTEAELMKLPPRHRLIVIRRIKAQLAAERLAKFGPQP